MRRCFGLMIVIIMLIFISFTTTGCSGSNDGDNSASEESKWDSMVWDRDKWG